MKPQRKLHVLQVAVLGRGYHRTTLGLDSGRILRYSEFIPMQDTKLRSKVDVRFELEGADGGITPVDLQAGCKLFETLNDLRQQRELPKLSLLRNDRQQVCGVGL